MEDFIMVVMTVLLYITVNMTNAQGEGFVLERALVALVL